MQPRIPGRRGDRRAQHALAFGIPAELPIEIGEIDRRRRVLRAEPQRGLVFGLGLGGLAAPRVEASERGARFRPIGVEALRGDELGRRALEALRDRREAGSRSEPRRAARRPGCARRDWNRTAAAKRAARAATAGTFSSMSSAPIRTIGSGSAEARPRQSRCSMARRATPSSLSALARAIAGALRSAATTASSAAASAWSGPRRMERLGVGLKAFSIGPVPALRSPPPPIPPTCRRDSRCRRWACRASPTDRAAECGSCDRAADRPPCRCAPACGTRRRRAPGHAVAWRWCATAAYLSAAWHCRQTPSPGARSLAPCGSWQSLQVTPAANILLCLNEP